MKGFEIQPQSNLGLVFEGKLGGNKDLVFADFASEMVMTVGCVVVTKY